ncbi:ATP/GTP-binding protein [Spirosoma soli]|uniref:ATP/GTP-binding protein n=1 Tax=Spirosoma soli TaxID=1770529 RepID=A0ABW5M2U2_9BACT
MLRSLEIRNYRNLRHLTIEKLGRVNLLVGKNNTGKTSVLEAIYLWANYGRLDAIYECIEARGGVFESISEDQYSRSQALITSLFTNRSSDYIYDGVTIDINEGETKSILRFNLRSFKKNLENISGEPKEKLVFMIESNKQTNAIEPLSILDPTQRSNYSFYWPNDIKNQFVKSNEIDSTNIGWLYDKIATTDLEDEVIGALKIIDESIIKLAFRVDPLSSKRYPVVRLEANATPVPLRSMGDGINRILAIILAMVNCENGYLLIDEFENGLHYSVQEKLWEIIFYLAERLNVQVFATTHSLDCVEAFSAILNNGKQAKEAGMMIRLENYEGNIEATVYDADEILSTTRVHVDPR